MEVSLSTYVPHGYTLTAAFQTKPNQALVAHSIHVLAAALTHPGMFDSIMYDSTRLLVVCNSVECLYLALLGEYMLSFLSIR